MARVESTGCKEFCEKAASIKDRVVKVLTGKTLSKIELSRQLGQRQVSGQLSQIVKDLVDEGIIVRTIPEKPQSRMQKYRIAREGEK